MTAKPCLRHLRPSRKPIESGIFIFGQINGDPVFRRHKLPHFAAKCSTLHLYASGSTLSQFQVCSLFVLIKSLQMQCFLRSEEHTSELQSLMRISYAVFCLKNKTD